MEETRTSARHCIERFYFLQHERVQTYDLFEEGFSAYLAGAPNYNFEMYKQLVHEITKTFKDISDEIISIQEQLATGHQALANILSSIQNSEKVKLEDTAKLQICRQNTKDHPEQESYKLECEELKQRLVEHKTNICEEMENLKFESEDLMEAT